MQTATDTRKTGAGSRLVTQRTTDGRGIIPQLAKRAARCRNARALADTQHAAAPTPDAGLRVDGLLRLLRWEASMALRSGQRARFVIIAGTHDALRAVAYGALD